MNKKTKKITAYIVGLGLLAAAVVFFTYYKVDSVQVRGTTHYSDEEVKKMVLRGPLASNSVLAPMIYSTCIQGDPDQPEYNLYQCKREKACGVYSLSGQLCFF